MKPSPGNFPSTLASHWPDRILIQASCWLILTLNRVDFYDHLHRQLLTSGNFCSYAHYIACQILIKRAIINLRLAVFCYSPFGRPGQSRQRTRQHRRRWEERRRGWRWGWRRHWRPCRPADDTSQDKWWYSLSDLTSVAAAREAKTLSGHLSSGLLAPAA